MRYSPDQIVALLVLATAFAVVVFSVWKCSAKAQRPYDLLSCIDAGQRSAVEQRALIAFQVIVMGHMGQIFMVDIQIGQWWQMSAVLFAYTAISLVCGFGWIIPCVAVGTMMGISADCVPKGGSIESQMRETVSRLVNGIVGGLLVGTFAELISYTARRAAQEKASDHTS